jgi:zinc transport system substrate-binding protein
MAIPSPARLAVGAATVFAMAVGLLAYATSRRSPLPPASLTLTVTASFYPLYFFAQQIGGDRAAVANLTPAGVEPHDYEPTAQDLAQIERSRLVVLNGGGFEPWGDKVRTTADPQHTLIVEAGEELTTRRVEEDGQSVVDPHVWLAPTLARRMADRIEQGFARADPDHATDYASNAARLTARLTGLDAAYRTGLSHCAAREIMTSHAAFGYLASAYGLTQIPIAGLSPDAEPSPRQLADVARFARDHHVTTIFFERLVSPKFAETIAAEVGAQTMVLDPIEGLAKDDLAAGRDYFSVMHHNLTNLEAALRCMS